MSKPSTGLILKTAAGEGLSEMLRLPLWWYTTGLTQTLGRLARSVKSSARYFGVDVWAKYLFVPMYGDTSLAGRAISFPVRLVVLLGKSLAVAAWLVIAFALAAIYLVILPIAIIGLFSHLVGVLV